MNDVSSSASKMLVCLSLAANGEPALANADSPEFIKSHTAEALPFFGFGDHCATMESQTKDQLQALVTTANDLEYTHFCHVESGETCGHYSIIVESVGILIGSDTPQYCRLILHEDLEEKVVPEEQYKCYENELWCFG